MLHPNKFLNIFIQIAAALLVLFSLQSCQKNPNTNNKNNNLEVESEVKTVVESVYDYYVRSDLKWVDFYNDTYTVIAADGSKKTNYADSLRKQWENIYKKYDVIVKYHDKPTVIGSGNQALHYNSVGEIFVDKNTKDTLSNNSGTWIALWKKQNDGSWKIILETYQAE